MGNEKRAEQAERYAEAWRSFEAEKQLMDSFHHELSEERHIANQLEAECDDLEQRLGIRRLQHPDDKNPGCGLDFGMAAETRDLSAPLRLQKPLRALSTEALTLADEVVLRTEQRLDHTEGLIYA